MEDFIEIFLKKIVHIFQEEWITAYRNEITVTSHDVISYAEMTLRLLKDVIFDRQNAYTIVAMVDYFVTIVEPFYQSRLHEVASGRPSSLVVAFSKLKETTSSGIDTRDATRIADGIYQVPFHLELGMRKIQLDGLDA